MRRKSSPGSGRRFEWSLIGAALVEGERVLGFTVAETLFDNTAVVHFEKANAGIPGVYQALNQMFCREYLGDYDFVNREQDLGIEGLRKAKLSYYPDHLIKKYTVKSC